MEARQSSMGRVGVLARRMPRMGVLGGYAGGGGCDLHFEGIGGMEIIQGELGASEG